MWLNVNGDGNGNGSLTVFESVQGMSVGMGVCRYHDSDGHNQVRLCGVVGD